MKTLSPEQIQAEAERLDKSEKTLKQIQPITHYHPDMTIEDAYLIQDAWVHKKINSGRKVIGHKIGLTSRVMQRAFEINEPDYGVLLDNMLYKSGESINSANFLEPRIEVELAFVLKNDLTGDNLSAGDVIDATDKILPALELIDFRTCGPMSGHKRTVKDTISDNAANAAIVLGENEIPKDADLKWISALLYKNGEIEDSGVAAAVLGHPANGVIWLARKYMEYGRVLKAGQIVLAGSFTSPVPVVGEDMVTADFGTYGHVSCSFY